MVKVVENGERICTVTLDGSESSIVFQSSYRYFAVKNESDADVYVSLNRNIVEGADGVMTIGSKESAVFPCMKPNVNMFFIKGKGKIQVIASSTPDNPFNFAPAFDGGVMASGNPVQIDGLQGGVPFSEMVVSGKNLLTYPYNETTKTVNGITFTDNGDGTITANGTATANATFRIDKDFGFEKEGNYFLSGCPSGGGLNSFYINWYQNHTGVTIKNYNDYGSGINISYQHIFSEYNSLAISIIAGATVENLVFRPQIELGDIATAYEPPIMGRELQVNVSGKNLLKPNKSTVTLNGITATMNDDGSITLSGTATANTYIGMWNNLYARSIGVGKITINAIDGQSSTTYYMGIDRREGSSYINRIAQSIANNGVGEITQEDVENNRHFYVWVFIAANYTANNLVFRPQLELGDTATAYEPYHGSTTTITPDSNPYTVPNDIRQVEGLNNISTSKGELSVTGVRKNAAIKKIWDKLDELTTAIIVSGGETE